jgi:hypothetical protein
MKTEPHLDGWYYRLDGAKHGPISTTQLKELLSAGQLQSRQAVWRQGGRRMFFLPAATAALGNGATASDS